MQFSQSYGGHNPIIYPYTPLLSAHNEQKKKKDYPSTV